ncbi:hypothetical protein CCACVL1_01048, partial [Corchorus capsularis]
LLRQDEALLSVKSKHPRAMVLCASEEQCDQLLQTFSMDIYLFALSLFFYHSWWYQDSIKLRCIIPSLAKRTPDNNFSVQSFLSALGSLV